MEKERELMFCGSLSRESETYEDFLYLFKERMRREYGSDEGSYLISGDQIRISYVGRHDGLFEAVRRWTCPDSEHMVVRRVGDDLEVEVLCGRQRETLLLEKFDGGDFHPVYLKDGVPMAMFYLSPFHRIGG